MNPAPKTIFVLGAGFSVQQGYPLVRHMKDEIICFLEREKHSSYWGSMQPWDGADEKGRFFDGLEKIDGNEQFQFEELLLKLSERLKRISEDPYLTTNKVLRIGAARRLWEIHESCTDVKPPYRNFASQLLTAWHRHGIISFNWDLQVERLLHQAKVPWHYDVTSQGRLPVIKPHGSINWSRYLQEGSHTSYPFWQPIRPDSRLSFNCQNPLANPDNSEIFPHLRYMIFAGDPDLSDSDEHVELLWKDAACLLDNAEEVVFIGYSFPDYDTYARKFFGKQVQGKKVVVINPSLWDLQKFKFILGTKAAEIKLRKETFLDCPYAQPTIDT